MKKSSIQSEIKIDKSLSRIHDLDIREHCRKLLERMGEKIAYCDTAIEKGTAYANVKSFKEIYDELKAIEKSHGIYIPFNLYFGNAYKDYILKSLKASGLLDVRSHGSDQVGEYLWAIVYTYEEDIEYDLPAMLKAADEAGTKGVNPEDFKRKKEGA